MSKKAKKAVRIWLSVLLSVILSVQFTVVGFAAVGESEVEPRLQTQQFLPIPLIEQEYREWCWAACGVSVTKYIRNISLSQGEFCYDAIGSYTNRSAYPYELQNGLAENNITSVKVQDTCPSYSECTHSPGYVLTLYEIRTQLAAQKPIIAQMYAGGASHFRVINGLNYNDVTNVATITYMEPWVEHGDPGIGDYVTVDFDEFCYTNDENMWQVAIKDLTEVS